MRPQTPRAVSSKSIRACTSLREGGAWVGGVAVQELVMLSLQNDFKQVVGVSSWMWLILVLQVRGARLLAFTLV
jgi:hypothetical protein